MGELAQSLWERHAGPCMPERAPGRAGMAVARFEQAFPQQEYPRSQELMEGTA